MLYFDFLSNRIISANRKIPRNFPARDKTFKSMYLINIQVYKGDSDARTCLLYSV